MAAKNKKKKTVAPLTRNAYQPPVSYLRRAITIPPELNAAIDEQIGSQNFSAFAQGAIAREQRGNGHRSGSGDR